MDERDFVRLLERRREDRGLEYKGSAPWTDESFRCQLVKEMLGMASLPDGGHIVIGVREDKTTQTFHPDGMGGADISTFVTEHVADFAAEYAEPYVEFELSRPEHAGNRFVLIEVRAFREMPVICRKDGRCLERGRVYTRTAGAKPEVAPIRCQTEMREILDRATELTVRKELDRLRRYGLIPEPIPPVADDRIFREQRKEV